MWRGGEPKSRSRSLGDRRRARRRSLRPHPPGGVAGRGGDVADREHRGAAGGAASGRVERRQRFGADRRQLVLAGDEDRRPDRGRHQDRGGDRRLGARFVDQGHRRRPLGVVGRRGRRRARRRRRWRPRRRRRPGSCSWSRRPDSRVRRSSPRERLPARAAWRRRRPAARRRRRSRCWLPPPRIAATMKTAARRIAPPTSFSGSGIRRRRRDGFGGFGRLARLRRSPPAAPLAGTSAFIGFSLANSGKLQAGTALAGRLNWLTDQSINP